MDHFILLFSKKILNQYYQCCAQENTKTLFLEITGLSQEELDVLAAHLEQIEEASHE